MRLLNPLKDFLDSIATEIKELSGCKDDFLTKIVVVCTTILVVGGMIVAAILIVITSPLWLVLNFCLKSLFSRRGFLVQNSNGITLSFSPDAFQKTEKD